MFFARAQQDLLPVVIGSRTPARPAKDCRPEHSFSGAGALTYIKPKPFALQGFSKARFVRREEEAERGIAPRDVRRLFFDATKLHVR